MPLCPNKKFLDGECIQVLTVDDSPVEDESRNKPEETRKSKTTSSQFFCSDSSWCFGLENVTPTSIFEWIGRKSEGATGKDITSESTVDTCFSKGVTFTASWPELRDPINLTVNRCNIHPFDNYAILHETLIDGLLKEARQRKAGNSSPERIIAKDKRTKRSPISTRSVRSYSAYSHKTRALSVMDISFQSTSPLLKKSPKQNKLSLRKLFKKRVKVPQLLEWKRQQKKHPIITTPEREPKKDVRQLQATPDSTCTTQSWSSQRYTSASHFNVDVIYPEVHLQKDKGNGKLIGEDISAKGRNSVLQKLREKMDIIIELETNKSSAVLKRIEAVGVQINDDIYETRSTIGVKMGFISLSYGILLQWKNDKMVHFICLRKMCTRSFMDEINDMVKRNLKLSKSISTSPCQSLSENDQQYKEQFHSPMSQSISEVSPIGSFDRKILKYATNDHENRAEGSKPNLKPPYLIKRPDSFPQATLEVTVLRARGLQTKRVSSKERWFNSNVRVSIGESSFRTNTVRFSKNPIFGGCKGNQNQCILYCTEETLKVEIFEWTPTSRSKLIGLCHLPLSLLEPQPQTGNISAKEVTLPCKMICAPEGPNGSIPFGSVSLSLIRRDANAYWIKKELRERNRIKRSFKGW